MCLPRWFEAQAAFLGPPFVLEIVPAAFQSDCDDWAGVLMAG